MRIVKPVTGFICALALVATSLAPAAQADQRGNPDKVARDKVDRFLGGRDMRTPRAPLPVRDPRGPGDFGNRDRRSYGGNRGRDYRGDRGKRYDKGYRSSYKKDYGRYSKGYGRYGKDYSRSHPPKQYRPRYHSPRRYVAPRYYAPKRYVKPRYVAPRYVAPRYVAPRYYAPKRVYRPVYRSYGHRYRIGHYYRFHPRTVIVTNHRYYGLYDPPYGYHWVRDNDSGDVILASIATGAIIGLAVGLLSGS